MKPGAKKCYRIIPAMLILLLTFTGLQAQQANYSDEWLKAEAYALAHITCKFELKKYQHEQEPDNSRLERETKKLDYLFRQFNLRSEVRYKRNAELNPRFNRFYKSAWKELSQCVKYQNILDVLEENRKQIR